MKNIIYLKGDATEPKVEGTKIITHICNNKGGWGRGFVLSLSKKWKEPEKAYRKCELKLGNAYEVFCEDDIYVVNMIAQN